MQNLLESIGLPTSQYFLLGPEDRQFLLKQAYGSSTLIHPDVRVSNESIALNSTPSLLIPQPSKVEAVIEQEFLPDVPEIKTDVLSELVIMEAQLKSQHIQVREHKHSRMRVHFPKLTFEGDFLYLLSADQILWIQRVCSFLEPVDRKSIESRNAVTLQVLLKSIFATSNLNRFDAYNKSQLKTGQAFNAVTFRKAYHSLSAALSSVVGVNSSRADPKLHSHINRVRNLLEDLARSWNNSVSLAQATREGKVIAQQMNQPAALVLLKQFYLFGEYGQRLFLLNFSPKHQLKEGLIPERFQMDLHTACGFVYFFLLLSRPSTRAEVLNGMVLTETQAALRKSAISGGHIDLFLSSHKTAATYGVLCVRFSVDVCEILSLFIERVRSTESFLALFTHETKKHLFPAQVGRYLDKFLSQHANSSSFSATNLRQRFSDCIQSLDNSDLFFVHKAELESTLAHKCTDSKSPSRNIIQNYSFSRKPANEQVLQRFVDSKFKLPAAREVQTWLALTTAPAHGTTSSTPVQPIDLDVDHLNSSSESEDDEALEVAKINKPGPQITTSLHALRRLAPFSVDSDREESQEQNKVVKPGTHVTTSSQPRRKMPRFNSDSDNEEKKINKAGPQCILRSKTPRCSKNDSEDSEWVPSGDEEANDEGEGEGIDDRHDSINGSDDELAFDLDEIQVAFDGETEKVWRVIKTELEALFRVHLYNAITRCSLLFIQSRIKILWTFRGKIPDTDVFAMLLARAKSLLKGFSHRFPNVLFAKELVALATSLPNEQLHVQHLKTICTRNRMISELAVHPAFSNEAITDDTLRMLLKCVEQCFLNLTAHQTLNEPAGPTMDLHGHWKV